MVGFALLWAPSPLLLSKGGGIGGGRTCYKPGRRDVNQRLPASSHLFVPGKGRIQVARRRISISISPIRASVKDGVNDKGSTGGSRRDFELNFRYSDESNRSPVICPECGGSGERECEWCKATGVLMLGDRLVCSLDGTTKCLVCNDGAVQCSKCRGSGSIAGWLLT